MIISVIKQVIVFVSFFWINIDLNLFPCVYARGANAYGYLIKYFIDKKIGVNLIGVNPNLNTIIQTFYLVCATILMAAFSFPLGVFTTSSSIFFSEPYHSLSWYCAIL